MIEDFIAAIELIRSEAALNEKQIEWLLSLRDPTNETLLHYFSIEREPAIVLKLIKIGFDVNSLDEFNYTPLTSAGLLEDNKQVIEILLSAGATPFIKDAGGLPLPENLELLSRAEDTGWIVDTFHKAKRQS